MLKSEARILYRQKRMALAENEMLKMDDLMLIRFQTMHLPFMHCLFSYWPIAENNEPNTHLFTDYIKFRNPELLLLYPRNDFLTNTMQAVAVEVDTPFEKKAMNIYEPASDRIVSPKEIDMAFVPLFAFDQKGYRIGYGRGFYDKYLQQCRPDCIKIGFCYFDPLEKIEDSNGLDIPLDICVTPNELYVF